MCSDLSRVSLDMFFALDSEPEMRSRADQQTDSASVRQIPYRAGGALYHFAELWMSMQMLGELALLFVFPEATSCDWLYIVVVGLV